MPLPGGGRLTAAATPGNRVRAGGPASHLGPQATRPRNAPRRSLQVVTGAPSEGSWFRFPADLAMPSDLTPFAQMVFKAIQTYGMVVVDQGVRLQSKLISQATSTRGPYTTGPGSSKATASAPTRSRTAGMVMRRITSSRAFPGGLQAVDPPQS